MEKSLFSAEYALLLQELREARRRAGMTQSDLAARLKTTQSMISKCERGERRLDVIELRTWCRALGLPFTNFLTNLEKALTKQRY